MDFSGLTNGSNENFSYLMNKKISEDKESVENSCSGRIFDEGVCGADLPTENKHEPLKASHEVRIMANEVGVSHLLSFL